MSTLKYTYLPIMYHLIPRVKGDTFKSIRFNTNINIANCDIIFTVYRHTEVLLNRSSTDGHFDIIAETNGQFRLKQFEHQLPIGVHRYDLAIIDHNHNTKTTYLKGSITII